MRRCGILHAPPSRRIRASRLGRPVPCRVAPSDEPLPARHDVLKMGKKEEAMLRKRSMKDSNRVKVSFALPEDHPHAAQAFVAGTFNGWDPRADPLVRRNNRTYSAVVSLEKGERYAYRYVSADGEWFNAGDADAYDGDNGILFT